MREFSPFQACVRWGTEDLAIAPVNLAFSVAITPLAGHDYLGLASWPAADPALRGGDFSLRSRFAAHTRCRSVSDWLPLALAWHPIERPPTAGEYHRPYQSTSRPAFAQ